MSQENVEIVQRVMGRWNAGDLGALLELAHPDVEVRLTGVWMDIPVSYRGYDGVREFWTKFREVWQEYSADLKEFIEINAEHVLVRAEFQGRGRQGVEVTRTFGQSAPNRGRQVGWLSLLAGVGGSPRSRGAGKPGPGRGLEA